ncbi:MAG TPA: thiamine pyrophosphate-dependent enzyme [Fimbriimonadaceae bacterium]|nr:thiamine pyrophosphate-dependent enzyme [Fimbriimonadaceae bacterium]
MPAQLWLGDEAVAWGAIDAGIGGAFAYAGTPATEIFETVEAFAPHVWARWSANEKVAYEEALGMSYAGKRALVSMKHVGLNVAADPFMSSALTGANGGIVLAIGDDPSMHSSQNEQDSRFYAEFAKIPILEPSTQQECYDMTRAGFEISEQFKLPVMLRLVTRLAHSRANVSAIESEQSPSPVESAAERPRPDTNDWTLVPAHARIRFHHLIELQPDLVAASDASPFNKLLLAGKRGVLCNSVAYNYVREALGPNPPDSILRIGQYPLPAGLIRSLVAHCDEILVIEEGYPFIEQRLTGLLGVPGKKIRGKLEGTLPVDGELAPDKVAEVLGVRHPHPIDGDSIVAGRPPQFCKGCPHAYTFSALADATAQFEHPILFSDIGCYALGLMPPYRAVHACVDMGASIGMAHGASRAGAHPVVCTIGDSTFGHSGMAGLLGAVRSDANITVMIMDNGTTAMTGTQDSMTTGETLIEILKGLGVKDLQVIEPLPKSHRDCVEAIRRAIDHQGLSVIVARRPCIHVKSKKLSAPLTQAAAAE